MEYLWDDWNIIREVVREGDSVAVTDNVWGLDLDGTLRASAFASAASSARVSSSSAP